jgi:choline dehydrogenase
VQHGAGYFAAPARKRNATIWHFIAPVPALYSPLIVISFVRGSASMVDYIVVGAGSAGCVLANRLSADPANRVLLLEAGPKDRSPMIHMPGGAAECIKSKRLNWQFQSTAQQGMNGRVIPIPRGKTLGGSSALNGMVYIRGHASDYDDWAAAGNKGWSYQEVLPYFKKSEHNERGGCDFHGSGGELHVRDAQSGLALFDMWVEAGVKAGMPRNSDFNGAEQEGVGLFQVTIKDGVRWSSANAFLKPAIKRPNLQVITGADVSRVLIEGDRAVGVEYRYRGKTQQIKATKEVVLSAGTIKSPHLLQLSGIGHPDDLAAVGITQRLALLGVGRNLQEHLDLKLNWSINQDIALNRAGNFPYNIGVALEYLFKKTGVAANSGIEGGAFWRSDEAEQRPDIQFHFVPAYMHFLTDPLPRQPGVTVRGCNLRPQSRGTVKPKSANPADHPLVDFNFLDNAHDMGKLLAALKMSREIMHSGHWNHIVDGVLTQGLESNDEDVLREVIKDTSDTVYHPVGTCKMGHDDMAVVDDQLRVHGLAGLRVCDASIIPSMIGGNTNAPAMMIAEKCADMMLAN